jgi:hypothetical protein
MLFYFQEKYLFQGCGFSLWHLEPSMRKNWLSAVMVIMYKYNFSPDTAMGERVIFFNLEQDASQNNLF